MKTKSIVTSIVVALLPIAGIAQTPPTPPAPPAPPAPPSLPDRHNHDHDKGPKVPVTFLGVETSSVPSVVSEQLGLAKGFGLVVDYVVPEGPAATAGIQQNDILKLLNDQILMEPGQLRKLLQTFTEGTNVTLTVLRKGQEQKITVKLAKKEVPQRHSMIPNLNHDWNFNFEDMGGMEDFGDLGEKMQGLKEQLKEQLGDARDAVREAVVNAQEEARQAQEEARQQAREATQNAREQARAARDAAREVRILSKDGALKATRIDLGKAQIVFSDDKGEMKLENVDGKKHFTAKDPQGKLLFSGPVESKEDIDKLPADIRGRFDKLQGSDLPAVAPRAMDDDDEDVTVNPGSDDDSDDEDDGASYNQVSFPHGNMMSMVVTI